MRIEQRGQMAAMQQLESKIDEELEAETKYKAAAQAILGYRAAERYDAKAARAHFQRALAAARPQERVGIRRMADASLALAERRADDLKKATERLGVESPTAGQLRSLRFLGLIAPPKSAGVLMRIRGVLIAIVLVIAVPRGRVRDRLRHRFGGRRHLGRYGDLLRLPARPHRARCARVRRQAATETREGRAGGTDRVRIQAHADADAVCGRYRWRRQPGRRPGAFPDR